MGTVGPGRREELGRVRDFDTLYFQVTELSKVNAQGNGRDFTGSSQMSFEASGLRRVPG